MKQLVIGLGEIGKPLFKILAEAHDEVYGRDVEPGDDDPGDVDVIHVCFPYSESFVDDVVGYVVDYGPDLIIIHSTVVPGTTDAVAKKCAKLFKIAYSPVKGRHRWMEQDLVWYSKFAAEATAGAYKDTEAIFKKAGLNVAKFPSVRGLELAKLLETSYSALLIAWAQEMERYCKKLDVEYLDVATFWYGVPHLPNMVHQPGYIGGHCLLPNLDLLDEVRDSYFTPIIRASNDAWDVVNKPDYTVRLHPLIAYKNFDRMLRGLPTIDPEDDYFPGGGDGE